MGPEVGSCPGCREPSTRRHSRYFRHLQDLPVQGAAVMVKMRVSRWRCLKRECERETFTDQLPEIVCPRARRTQRIAQLVHLLGYGAGGRPAERLMKRLAMPVSDDTILRHLKRQVAHLHAKTTVRVAGIDDWSWRKGRTYGTIIVDLERREVVDVLADRTTTGTAEWLGQHLEVEIVSRDRCGLYAQGAHEGAPQARQVADRFHLLQNLRETIETQLSRADRSTGRALLPESNDEDPATTACGSGGRGDAAAHRHLIRQAHHRSRQAIFDQIHILREAGTSIGDIARQTGFGPRSIRKWLKFTAPPERRATAPKPCSPNYFLDYLSRRWEEGCVRGRELLYEIKLRGYTGSFSHLERLLAKWRRANDTRVVTLPPVPEPTTAPTTTITTVPRAVDPATGWTISPIVAASLCIKPRGLLTPRQAAKVDALKSASPDFIAMRRLAMRFPGDSSKQRHSEIRRLAR
jgi:Transposase/zinc-finger of transposase IS204/IS1001/IS1096/IS1165